MKRESTMQTIYKNAPLIITIGSVVIALINALIFIRTDSVRQEIKEVKGQHQVMAQEFIDHKTNQVRTETQMLEDIKEIKQDVKTLLQRR